jgi:hypothetical protein
MSNDEGITKSKMTKQYAIALCHLFIRAFFDLRHLSFVIESHLPLVTAASTVSAMLEYELYLPLHYNDGRPIDPEKLKNLKRRLVDEFGGLTHFRQENEGLWKIGDHTFRDRVEIVRVLANDEVSAQKYFAQLKFDLTRDFNQQDFLIVSRQVTAV